jgi:hypothetical protein
MPQATDASDPLPQLGETHTRCRFSSLLSRTIWKRGYSPSADRYMRPASQGRRRSGVKATASARTALRSLRESRATSELLIWPKRAELRRCRAVHRSEQMLLCRFDVTLGKRDAAEDDVPVMQAVP